MPARAPALRLGMSAKRFNATLCRFASAPYADCLREVSAACVGPRVFRVIVCQFLGSLTFALPPIQCFDRGRRQDEGAQAHLQQGILLLSEWTSMEGAVNDRL